MLERRVAGEPLEYIVGWVQFCGLRIAIDEGVFVPRQRTEFLVIEAARVARPAATVLDLCCGSGAIGVALAASLGAIELHATDIEPAAVRCARRNLDPIGANVYDGDLFRPLPAALRGRIDVVVANVPYVPTDAISLMPPEAREHEPMVTLDGGADGLDILRRVAAEAGPWLAPGGHVLIEIQQRQAAQATDAFGGGGLIARVASSDEFSATVVIGTKRAIQPAWPSRRP